MGRFEYSKNEMDLNKVLKMNKDLSDALANDDGMNIARNNADKAINDSLALLRSMGKQKEINNLSAEIDNKLKEQTLNHKPKLESWEQIVAQAYEYEPYPVVLEDIMTPSEIQAAFDELDEIDKQFSHKTSIINKKDLKFLAIATALQVAKSLIFPYVAEKFDYGKSFNPDDRLKHDDKTIEQAHRNANDKYRDEHLKKHDTGYWINILYQTPPYDIVAGSKDLGLNMSGNNHRLLTLGHDPVLGWIFGTANILTDCITFNSFNTNRVIRIDPKTQKKKMIITPESVPIGAMFRESYEMAKADRLNLPAAIFAQAQHLKSDEFTKMGLPVPLLSAINENFASKLYKEHYDALCFKRDIKIIGASFIVSKLIDIIITLAHGIFREKNEEKDLYEVRTRKILLVSNMIASTSTIINAAVTSNPKNLDLGSLLNTISHLFLDIRFITKIKEEFIENEISTKVQKEILEIDGIYENI